MVRTPLMTFDQSAFDIRCEWGANGVHQLAPISDAIIIVDLLSFSTCVAIATSRGAHIFPYPYNDDTRFAFARSINAELAGPRGTTPTRYLQRRCRTLRQAHVCFSP